MTAYGLLMDRIQKQRHESITYHATLWCTTLRTLLATAHPLHSRESADTPVAD
jgi:hypothetical protein